MGRFPHGSATITHAIRAAIRRSDLSGESGELFRRKEERFMGKPQRRSARSSRREAVRLVETNGRTQREIAESLGIGRSTLRVGLIHHANRGRPYGSTEYQAELPRHSIQTSMSGKRNCYDNAMVETFFKTRKSELVLRIVFQNPAEATSAISLYIDGVYNPVRHHSAVDFTSLLQFERQTARRPNRSRLSQDKST